MDYPTPDQIKAIVISILESEDCADIDDLIYDKISDFDQYFQNDSEWLNEDGNDLKDSLRDQVIELLEAEGILV